MINRFLPPDSNDELSATVFRHAQLIRVSAMRNCDGTLAFDYEIQGGFSADEVPPGFDPLDFARTLLSHVQPREERP